MIRSAVLGQALTPAGPAVTVMNTVPAGETWILKHASAANGAVAAATTFVRVRNAASTLYGYLIFATIPASTAQLVIAQMVAEAGDVLEVFCDQAGVQVWVSGSRLVEPA